MREWINIGETHFIQVQTAGHEARNKGHNAEPENWLLGWQHDPSRLFCYFRSQCLSFATIEIVLPTSVAVAVAIALALAKK